jgi:Lrp/AsnC family transcriptional regulator
MKTGDFMMGSPSAVAMDEMPVAPFPQCRRIGSAEQGDMLREIEKNTMTTPLRSELVRMKRVVWPIEQIFSPGALSVELDAMDLKILALLQADATMPIAEIGKAVGLSTTPCWRRIQKLDEAGVIRARVAILDPAKVNVGVTVFVSIKTDQHSVEWLERFHGAVADLPEIAEFYRMSGEIDYLMRVVVPDIAAYDAFYKKLISRIDVSKISSAFAMEQIKYTTALPLSFALAGKERGRG